MATDTHNIPIRARDSTPQQLPTRTCPRSGFWAALCGLGTRVVGLFTRRTKARRVPVVHENVALSDEGAKLWQEVSDSTSPVGKLTNHRQRRLSNGDAAG